jgi:hypothetical protein
LKYYIYVSDAKVEMLANQLLAEEPSRSETSTQVGIKSLLSLEHKTVHEGGSNMYKKLDAVLEWVRSYGDIGSIDAPGSYIGDMAPMHWGIYHIGANHPMQDLGDKAPVVFWTETASTYFLMFGSPIHLVGRNKAPAGVGLWSASDVVQYLLADVLNQSDALNEEGFHDSVCRRIWGNTYQDRLMVVWQQIKAVSSPPATLDFVAKRLTAFNLSKQNEKSILIASPIYVALSE